MSLLEIMVAIAILLVLTVVVIPGISSMMGMDKRKGARKLALIYERLNDEAVMRNRTYRIVYFLNEDRYVVEAGEPGALIAATPEDREEYEVEVRAKMAAMSDEERQRWLHKNKQPFESLGEGRMEVNLPAGMVFGGVYTPQYGELVEPDGADDEDEKQRVESYVMSNGFTEHTIIWLVNDAAPTAGYTIEVAPLSGEVTLHGELVDWRDAFAHVPDEGPALPQ